MTACSPGNVDTVAAAFNDFQVAAAALGLKVALGRDKSLLVPCAKQACVFDRNLFPDRLEVQWDGNFELLGSPIGDAAHCRKHTSERVGEACRILEALGEVPGLQVAKMILL